MRVDRRVSPNQAALWTIYELRNGAGQRPGAVRLACYYRRSTRVNRGQLSHPRAQVRGGELGRPPIFQAGHAGSIPVTRSGSVPRRSDGVSPRLGNTSPFDQHPSWAVGVPLGHRHQGPWPRRHLDHHAVLVGLVGGLSLGSCLGFARAGIARPVRSNSSVRRRPIMATDAQREWGI
jgi:hypothetical protein